MSSNTGYYPGGFNGTGRLDCPRCHKGQLWPISGQFTTGVVAPDGGREMLWQEGYQCDKCGMIIDADDHGAFEDEVDLFSQLIDYRGEVIHL